VNGPEHDAIAALAGQVGELVTREDERRKEKAETDQYRARLRTADENRWDGFDKRLDRVQSDVVDLRKTVDVLPTTLDAKLRESSERIGTTAAKVASDLAATTEVTAAHLKTATAALALMQKDAADRRMAARSLSAGMRSVVTALLLAAIIIVTIIVFTDQDSLTQSILILAAVSSPSIAALAFIWRKAN
jgi:uncharacterized membrane protein YqjE